MSQFTFFPAPSDPGYAQIYDDASPTPNPIGSPVAIAAGTTVPVTAPHGTVMTSDMGDPVMDVLSGETKPLPKSKILFNDASDALAFTDLYDNKFDGNLYPGITIPRRELKDSASAGIGIYASLDGLIDDTIDDIPDSAITVNGAAFANVKSTAGLDVPVKNGLGFTVGSKVGNDWIVPTRNPDGAPIIYNLGWLLFSGQTTVYQAGDEGTMYANGFFNYNPTIGPNSVMARLTNFTTLVNNNSFGNTRRFTDRAGAAAASSGNRFVMDHYVGVEYYILNTWVTSANWAAAVTSGVTINTTLGESGWYLPNDRLLDNATNDNTSGFATDPPFSMPAGTGTWSSSTAPGSTTNAKFLGLAAGQMGSNAKTGNAYIHGIYVRRFI